MQAATMSQVRTGVRRTGFSSRSGSTPSTLASAGSPASAAPSTHRLATTTRCGDRAPVVTSGDMADNDLLKRLLDAGMTFTAMTQARAEELIRDLVRAGAVRADQAQ